ncbi:probable peptide chain release factor C12orf65 homolog, mitochondrial [Actinia tenebrosa]|uniref:Probable peptide chain release factor C12orf65 homolog, mitochondrial n=1 Tax=Actinia tenebrosa TaxID=6105 RepID=A0A6P8I022_ACTTE|nr:probable peptide chain release factor C12orf65 homolog, mitochondrial [Actinia tenebrosa]
MFAFKSQFMYSFLTSIAYKNSFFTSALRFYQRIVLSNDDLEEKFVKGWGKGGQKVNKTSNCVELKHVPTGLVVKCHQSRSLIRNRAIAREILEKKLDFMINGSKSVLGQEIVNKKKRKYEYERKRRAKEEAMKQGVNDTNENK